MTGDSPRILVAGLGNIFLGDDGFGVEVVRRLSKHPPDGEVRIVDFGIRGVDLVYNLLDRYDLAILVDTVSRGGRPGTLYLIEPDTCCEQGQAQAVALDGHDMDPGKVLRMVSWLGGRIGRVLLVGCEPACAAEEAGILCGLSEAVDRAVGEAIGMIHRLVAEQRGVGCHRADSASA